MAPPLLASLRPCGSPQTPLPTSTIAAPGVIRPLFADPIDPPTISMSFGVNDSVLAGKVRSRSQAATRAVRVHAHSPRGCSVCTTALAARPNGAPSRAALAVAGAVPAALVRVRVRLRQLCGPKTRVLQACMPPPSFCTCVHSFLTAGCRWCPSLRPVPLPRCPAAPLPRCPAARVRAQDGSKLTASTILERLEKEARTNVGLEIASSPPQQGMSDAAEVCVPRLVNPLLLLPPPPPSSRGVCWRSRTVSLWGVHHVERAAVRPR
jgi:hypothetical protein